MSIKIREFGTASWRKSVKFENKIVEMRKCLTKFGRIFECGAASLHCCGLMVSSPGPCASSGGRLPEALFMVFLLDSKSAKSL